MLIKFKLDYIITNWFDYWFWIKRGSLFNDIVLDIAPKFVQLFPRFVWTFVQLIVGINEVPQIDPARLPMLAVNDLGGVSSTNLKHW